MANEAINSQHENGISDPKNRVRAGQITQVYNQSLLGGLPAICGGICLMAVLWYQNPRPLMIVWILTYLAVFACRIILVKAFQGAQPTESETLIWGRWHWAVTVASNLLWGFAAMFLFPMESQNLQVFFVIFVGGITAGSAVMYAPTGEYWGNILLALAPLSARFFYEGGQYDALEGTLLLLFGLVMAMLGMNTRRLYVELLRLRFEKDELIEDLKTQISERTQTLQIVSRLRMEAEAASSAKTGFLTNMSHELRTPLNAILGFSDLLIGQFYGKLNDKQLEYVREISQAGRHFLALINGILDLAKVESGKMDLEISPVWIGQLLENCLTMIRETAMKRGLAVELKIPTGLADKQISADELKLKQIIVNLLGNAAKFTPRGGSITLEADQRGTELRISVADTGIGIRVEDQARIFEAFEQLDVSLSRKEAGTGLGLALARKLVEIHGGRIWVESEGEGKGSIFRFIIPLVPIDQNAYQNVLSAQAQNAPDALPRIDGGDIIVGQTVLVVEDDPASMRLAVNLLKAGGYTAIQANSADEGIKIAGDQSPALILMDISLPGIDGLAATRILKEKKLTAHIPVVALTAHAMKGDEPKARDAGCDAYLAKPIKASAFYETLSILMKKSRQNPPPAETGS